MFIAPDTFLWLSVVLVSRILSFCIGGGMNGTCPFVPDVG